MRSAPLAAVAALALVASGTAVAHAPAPHRTPFDREGDALLARSLGAALGTRSVRVVASSSTASISSVMTRDHRADMRVRQGAGRARIIRIRAVSYTRANAAFLRNQGIDPATVARYSGVWIKDAVAPKDLKVFLDKRVLLRLILRASGTARIAGSGHIDGQPVVFLRDSAENGTLAVRATRAPYPVRLDFDASAQGAWRFSGWDEDVVIRAPKTFIDVS